MVSVETEHQDKSISRGRPSGAAQPAPIRVLLMGEDWASLAPFLSVLKHSDITFIGPLKDGIDWPLHGISPAVVLAGLDVKPHRLALIKEAGGSFPPVLLCLTTNALEREDLPAVVHDFIVLPCSALELEKRIKRLVPAKRQQRDTAVLRVGPLELDPATYEVTADGSPVKLAWMEFQLLRFLMQHPDVVFTRGQLQARVWGHSEFGDSRTVDVHIRRLRYKLGIELFRTVKNVGYSLVNPG